VRFGKALPTEKDMNGKGVLDRRESLFLILLLAQEGWKAVGARKSMGARKAVGESLSSLLFVLSFVNIIDSMGAYRGNGDECRRC